MYAADLCSVTASMEYHLAGIMTHFRIEKCSGLYKGCGHGVHLVLRRQQTALFLWCVFLHLCPAEISHISLKRTRWELKDMAKTTASEEITSYAHKVTDTLLRKVSVQAFSNHKNFKVQPCF